MTPKQDNGGKCVQRVWRGKRHNDDHSSGRDSSKPLCDGGKKGSAVNGTPTHWGKTIKATKSHQG